MRISIIGGAAALLALAGSAVGQSDNPVARQQMKIPAGDQFCGVSDQQARNDAIRLHYLLQNNDCEHFFGELEAGYVRNNNGKQCGLQTMMKYLALRDAEQVHVMSWQPEATPGHLIGGFPTGSPDPSIVAYSINLTDMLTRRPECQKLGPRPQQ